MTPRKGIIWRLRVDQAATKQIPTWRFGDRMSITSPARSLKSGLWRVGRHESRGMDKSRGLSLSQSAAGRSCDTSLGRLLDVVARRTERSDLAQRVRVLQSTLLGPA